MPDDSVIIGGAQKLNQKIYLAPYDCRWPKLFDTEKERIRQALGSMAIGIEHTGSTSVPGLVAKPIIDVTVVVPDSSDEPSYVPAMEQAGYVLRVREPDWFEHRMFKGPQAEANIHVFSEGCSEVAAMIRFRDWLRAHPEDRDLYARAKVCLAARNWEYVQDYADAKSDVIQQILARATAE